MTTKKVFREYDEEFIEHFQQVVSQEARLMEIASIEAHGIGYEEPRANHAAAYSLATKALKAMPGLIFYTPSEDVKEHLRNWPLFRQTLGFTGAATTRGEIEAFIEQVVLMSAEGTDGQIPDHDVFLASVIEFGDGRGAILNLDLNAVNNHQALARALVRFYYDDEANYRIQLERAYTATQWCVLNSQK